jgi:small conductance mechanosensitive channel
VASVIQKVHEDLRGDPSFSQDIIAPMEMLGLDRFTESAIILRARTTTRPIQQWRVAREFNRRLKIAFDEKNIEMPFREITVHMAQDGKGGFPRFAAEADGNTDTK